MNGIGHGISQSAISVYRNCPFAYCCYKQKKQPIMFNPDVLDSGKFVHDAIDYYYKKHFLVSDSYEMILEKTYGYLRNQWDTTLPLEELKKVYTCLVHHSEWEYQNHANGCHTKPLSEEVLKNNIFYGIVDYIDLPNKKVVDWKTNKFAVLSFEYRMQAYIYKVLFEDTYKEPLNYFYFFFLYSNEWRTVKFDAPGMDKVIQEVELLKESVLQSIQNNDYPKKPRIDSQCANCNYRLYCRG